MAQIPTLPTQSHTSAQAVLHSIAPRQREATAVQRRRALKPAPSAQPGLHPIQPRQCSLLPVSAKLLPCSAAER